MTPNTLMRASDEETRAHAAPDATVQLSAFRVGHDEMVLDIMRVREIMRPIAVTPLPGAPEGVRGLIHVRGTVIPLVDVRMRFGLPPDDGNPKRRVMVVLDRHRLFGLQVDGVSEVVRVSRDALRSGAGIFGGQAAQIFSGICEHKGRLLLMLNLSRFLTTEERLTIPSLPPRGASNG